MAPAGSGVASKAQGIAGSRLGRHSPGSRRLVEVGEVVGRSCTHRGQLALDLARRGPKVVGLDQEARSEGPLACAGVTQG